MSKFFCGYYRGKVFAVPYKDRLNAKTLRPVLWELKKRMAKGLPGAVSQDNDRVQNAASIMAEWRKLSWKKLEGVPRYSPDLNLMDAVLFGTVKSLTLKKFQDNKNVPRTNAIFDNTMVRIMQSKPVQAACEKFLANYRKRLQAVVDAGGEIVK